MQGGSTVIVFTVAHTESYTDKQGAKQTNTTWVRCTKWVNQGQSTKIAEYLKKGIKVYVEGKPTASAYTAQDGTLRASLELNVRDIELSGAAAQPQAGAVAQPTNPNVREQPVAPQAQAPSREFTNQPTPMSFEEDDLPF